MIIKIEIQIIILPNMKKLILITGLLLLTFNGFSQSVKVNLIGCQGIQEGTAYVAHVMVMKDFIIVSQNTVVVENVSLNSSKILVPLPSFCTGDIGPVYQLLVEGGKVIIETKEELCRGKDTFEYYECSDYTVGIEVDLAID